MSIPSENLTNNPDRTNTNTTVSQALIATDQNKTASELLTLVEFIETRQQQKQHLVQKNSLSKNKLTNKKIPKKMHETAVNSQVNNDTDSEKIDVTQSSQALKKLIQLLGEQLSEGHTIYTLTKITPRQRLLFKRWQQQGWLTVLTTEYAHDTKQHLVNKSRVVNTPIVMQYLTPQTEWVGDNDPPGQQAVFWLQRQWYAEWQLARQLLAMATRTQQPLSVSDTHTVDSGTQDDAQKPNAEQQQAIESASRFALSIITGGPGTGKTFTVAKLVTRLQQAHNAALLDNPHLPPLAIALTAPTGKAAQRMQESLSQSLNGEAISLESAKTLHRLLGIGTTGLPRYHADNPLPYDLVIVDEASMLGLELASLLVDAIKPSSRLIVLGDANQLAAVDAGSVLADLCQVPALQPYRTELVQSKRFDDNSQVGQLAKAIGQSVLDSGQDTPNKLAKIRRLLTKSSFDQPFELFDSHKAQHQTPMRFYALDHDSATPTASSEFWRVYQTLAQPYQAFFDLMKAWYVNPPDIQEVATRQQLFQVFDRYRVLTAGHQGQLGSEALNKKLADRYLRSANIGQVLDFFYHGMPVMIKHNDYPLGLFNGDIGICLEIDKTLWVCFADKVINSSRLSQESCDRAYAMTIHKSQGSEFDNVAVCLDNKHARLLSQELVYTAVTRSKGGLMVVSPERLLLRAVLQQGNRQTGLALQFF